MWVNVQFGRAITSGMLNCPDFAKFLLEYFDFLLSCSVMTDTPENIKRWADGWQQTDAELRAIKAAELRQPDYVEKTLTALEDLFNYSLEHSTPSETSGLVEMQRYFAMLRPK